MKKIILLLIFALPFFASAQGIDSTKIFIKNITFQARDIELLTPLMLSGQELYEDFYDIAKTKFRVANPPANLTNVTIDSLRTDVIISIARWMRTSDYGTVANFFARVDAVIKAIPNTYLQGIISEMDAAYVQRIIEVRTEGRRRLRGIRL